MTSLAVAQFSTGPAVVELSALTSRGLIEAQLEQLSFQEAALDQTLSSLIQSRTELGSLLHQLSRLEEVVDPIVTEAVVMADKVADVAETAERVGGKVRVLDQEQVSSNHTELHHWTLEGLDIC